MNQVILNRTCTCKSHHEPSRTKFGDFCTSNGAPRHQVPLNMPREIVAHNALITRSAVSLEKWIDRYYIPANYNSGRVAVYEQIGQKQKEDYTYRVKSVEENFRPIRAQNEDVILLGVPYVIDTNVEWLKKYEDEKYCNRRSGLQSEPSWCHCVHADYSRAGEFLFSATRPDEDFELQLGVAISVLETMRFYCQQVHEVKELSRKIFDMPQVSDTMQKYIACIVLGECYNPVELLTMVQTAITRNLRWKSDDLLSTSAMLILLPLVKHLFTDSKQDCISRQSAVPQIHEEYKAKLASFDMFVKYHQGATASQSDNWNAAKTAKASRYAVNAKWINTVCELAANFGVTQVLLQSLQQEMQDTTGQMVFKFKLPNEDVPWIRNRAPEMRVVRFPQGARAVGLSIQHRCYLTLSPKTRDVIQYYCVHFKPTCEGGGTFSVSSDRERCTTKNLMTTHPIHLEMNTQSSTCLVKQGNVEFTLDGKRLNVQFSGGALTMTASLRKAVTGNTCSADNSCGICLMDTEPSHIKYITDCKHIYHKQCIDRWINHCVGKPTCPMCRCKI